MGGRRMPFQSRREGRRRAARGSAIPMPGRGLDCMGGQLWGMAGLSRRGVRRRGGGAGPSARDFGGRGAAVAAARGWKGVWLGISPGAAWRLDLGYGFQRLGGRRPGNIKNIDLPAGKDQKKCALIGGKPQKNPLFGGNCLEKATFHAYVPSAQQSR